MAVDPGIYSPITSATDGSLACNKPGTVTNPQLSATAPAGSQITAYWGNWPHDVGPVMVYMANCGGSCTNANPSSLNWFKIDESGLISGQLRQGFWGQGQLQKSNNSWTSTIPKSLPNGNYMIRHELLAIHTPKQPQWYPECAQLTVTGGGSGNPSPTVRFPGAYNQNDPSINIDLYSQTGTTYKYVPCVFLTFSQLLIFLQHSRWTRMAWVNGPQYYLHLFLLVSSIYCTLWIVEYTLPSWPIALFVVQRP